MRGTKIVKKTLDCKIRLKIATLKDIRPLRLKTDEFYSIELKTDYKYKNRYFFKKYRSIYLFIFLTNLSSSVFERRSSVLMSLSADLSARSICLSNVFQNKSNSLLRFLFNNYFFRFRNTFNSCLVIMTNSYQFQPFLIFNIVYFLKDS